MPLQIWINGLGDGLSLALFALGVALVNSAIRVPAFALAGIYSLCPFIAWQILQMQGPLWFAMLVAVASGICLGMLLEWFNYRPMARRGASEATQILAGLGLLIVMAEAAALIWTTDSLLLRTGADRMIGVGSMRLSHSQILLFIIPLPVLMLFFLCLYRARLGLYLRALSDNPRELMLRGQNINRLRLLTFMVAGALTAVSALLSANDLGFDNYGGMPAFLLALVAMVLAGRNALAGVVIAAIVLGVVRAMVGWCWAGHWQDVATFMLLAMLLLLRPDGLLGRRQRLEARF